jgi:hypothetical protein
VPLTNSVWQESCKIAAIRGLFGSILAPLARQPGEQLFLALDCLAVVTAAMGSPPQRKRLERETREKTRDSWSTKAAKGEARFYFAAFASFRGPENSRRIVFQGFSPWILDVTKSCSRLAFPGAGGILIHGIT